jgi:hypothetical protein
VIDPPLAEGFARPGLWVVVYAAGEGAVDVLVFRAKTSQGRVDLGACVFAGRVRGETWCSTIGDLPPRERAAVAEWVRTSRPAT